LRANWSPAKEGTKGGKRIIRKRPESIKRVSRIQA
jgi:hypothetical protein